MPRTLFRIALVGTFVLFLAFGAAMIVFSLDETTTPAPTLAAFPISPQPAFTYTVLPSPTAPPAPVAPLTTAALPPTVAPSPTVRVQVPWTEMPVIPVVSEKMKRTYLRGLQVTGNSPKAFAKVGDCESSPNWFLGDFDKGGAYYTLGEYKNLRQVISQYQNSYSRTSLAAKSGFSAAAVFGPLWANPEFCAAGESPLACEYRVHKPSIAFIMLGTNDYVNPNGFEPQLRAIILYSLQQGVVPILATKADNLEGTHQINASIAKLAVEYDVPLWNFWAAVKDLPDGGLQADKAHLTWGPNQFDEPENMKKAWPVRNLTALQALDAVWRAVSQ